MMETEDDLSGSTSPDADEHHVAQSRGNATMEKWGPRMNVICVAASGTAFLLVIVFLLLALHLSSTSDIVASNNRTNATT